MEALMETLFETLFETLMEALFEALLAALFETLFAAFSAHLLGNGHGGLLGLRGLFADLDTKGLEVHVADQGVVMMTETRRRLRRCFGSSRRARYSAPAVRPKLRR